MLTVQLSTFLIRQYLFGVILVIVDVYIILVELSLKLF